MKLHYEPETDSLYIKLTDGPSDESEEIARGVVADFDAGGNLVGLDVEHASQRFDLRDVEADVGAAPWVCCCFWWDPPADFRLRFKPVPAQALWYACCQNS